jgi:predicted site-specific integrase-resolvase
MDDTLLTMKEVLKRLGDIHPNTLYRYINTGKLPIVQLSRSKRFIKEKDLELFINSHTGLYK